jgi:hypothetical protein
MPRRLIGVSVREYREIEAGDRMPRLETGGSPSCTGGRRRSSVGVDGWSGDGSLSRRGDSRFRADLARDLRCLRGS